jgi:hypothetical protein
LTTTTPPRFGGAALILSIQAGFSPGLGR